MRELIRYILKEETTPDEVRRGIDIAIKILKKEYPFVVGWDYSDPPETYTYKVYINLEIDFLKAMKFYNLNPHPRYGKFIKDAIKKRESYPYPFSMMNYEEVGFDTDEVFNLQSELSEFYKDMIPNTLKMKKGEKGIFNQNDPKELAVDNYIFVE